jgi:polyisoprenoid-binding protein YceI
LSPADEAGERAVSHYRIVPERSRLIVEGRSSVHPLRLTATGLEGRLDLRLTEAGIDVASVGARLSVPVARLRSGNRFEDRELRRRVDAARFPDIDATLTGLSRGDGAGGYRAVGEVRFHGVARTEESDVVVEVLDGRSVRIEGAATFDVRAFGVEPPRLFGLRVDAEVRVRLEVVAVEDRPTA